MPDGSPDLGCGSYSASCKRPVAWLISQIVIAYQQMVLIGAPLVQLGIIARQIWQNLADNVAVIRAVQGMAELDIGRSKAGVCQRPAAPPLCVGGRALVLKSSDCGVDGGPILIE